MLLATLSAKTQSPLTPVFNSSYVTDRQRRIELIEGKKFHDEGGNIMFRLHDKRLTLSGRIIISDSKGAEIGYIRRKHRSGGRNQTDMIFGYRGSGKCDIGAVNVDGTNCCPAECKAKIYVDGNCIGETAGSWFMKEFAINVEGESVAKILRTAQTAEGGFSIINAEGVDMSFILMVIMALGEIYGWADSYNGGVSSNILSNSVSFSEHDCADVELNRIKHRTSGAGGMLG